MKRSKHSTHQNSSIQYYKIGDKVEAIRKEIGAWFHAEIVDMLPYSSCLCGRKCTCIFKLLFEGDDEEDDRCLDEIRPITYSSYNWEDLKPGMKVVINYNVDNPGTWGYWYDFVIKRVIKRKLTIHLQGNVLIGYNGSKGKIYLEIDSDNVADVLEIKPHATLEEKERDDYETGLKPEYCEQCKNKPIKKCKKCACSICGVKADYMITLQCDECCKWFHTYCLEPPLMEMPSGDDWYCPGCSNENQKKKYESKSKLKSNKISKEKEQKPKKKYIRRDPKRTENSFSVGQEIDQRVKTQFLLSEDTKVEEITKKITYSYTWNEIKKWFPNHDIEGIYVAIRERKIIPDNNNTPDKEFDLPLNVELCISNDDANKHLWDEAKKYLSKGKKTFLEEVQSRFTCPICQDLLKKPITLGCKHSFCITCFFRSLSKNVYNCALCRTGVAYTDHYSVNENLNNALSALFSK